MQLRFLTLALIFFFFTLCTPKRLLALQHEGLNISRPIIQEQEAQGKNGTLVLQMQRVVNGGGAEMGRSLVFTIRKTGVSGGSNIVRKPRPMSSALTLSARSYPMLCLRFGLMILVSLLL